MMSQRIPGESEAVLWSLVAKVCHEAKLDLNQEQELFPTLFIHLSQRWINECQSLTDLEVQDWTNDVRQSSLSLAKKSREQVWRRVLFYKRCKYLRYVIALSASTVTAYLCPQQTIFLEISDVQHLWSGWYHLFTFFAVAGVPVGLAVAVIGNKFAFRHVIQWIVTAAITLGFTLPVGLSFVSLVWRWRGAAINPLDWVAALVAVPFCVVGLITASIEVLWNHNQHRVHPLRKVLPVPRHPENTVDVRAHVEQHLAQTAFAVCNGAHMDEDAFQYKVAENIRNSLFNLWRKHLQECNDPLEALNTVLKEFGPVASAADGDPGWMRILFYERHAAVRYLAVIGLALIVLYVQLIAVEFPVQGEGWRWGLWNENVLNGTIIASCILVAKHSWLVKLRPVSLLFGFGAAWGIQQVCFDALNALITIHDDWSKEWAICGLLIGAPTLCLAIIGLICCTISECFHPIPASIVANIQRWRYQLRSIFV